MDRIRNAVGNFFSLNMKNMAAVESDDKSPHLVRTGELISNLKKQVVAEERWELPSGTQGDGATAQPAERQKGVVIALEDGKTRYLVRRIPDEQKVGVVDVIVTYASHMDRNWVRVEEKQVHNVRLLEDYLDQDEDTKCNLGEGEDKKESTDVQHINVNLVQSDEKEDCIEDHSRQSEKNLGSSDKHTGSKDTESKM